MEFLQLNFHNSVFICKFSLLKNIESFNQPFEAYIFSYKFLKIWYTEDFLLIMQSDFENFKNSKWQITH